MVCPITVSISQLRNLKLVEVDDLLRITQEAGIS